MKLALIPARGGSKRIQRKNIRPFLGKPVIAYSIEAAQAAGCFDRIICSTDDAEISAVAHIHGADIPFLRPAELADDHATTLAVIAHAVEWCDRQGYDLEAICCLYPVAPLISGNDLAAAYEIFAQEKADWSFPVAHFPSPIQRALRIRHDGVLERMQPELETARSQDLEDAFYDVGQFYWCSPEAAREGRQAGTSHSVPLVIPSWRVQDIDTEEDWQRAEMLYQLLHSSSNDQRLRA